MAGYNSNGDFMIMADDEMIKIDAYPEVWSIRPFCNINLLYYENKSIHIVNINNGCPKIVYTINNVVKKPLLINHNIDYNANYIIYCTYEDKTILYINRNMYEIPLANYQYINMYDYDNNIHILTDIGLYKYNTFYKVFTCLYRHCNNLVITNVIDGTNYLLLDKYDNKLIVKSLYNRTTRVFDIKKIAKNTYESVWYVYIKHNNIYIRIEKQLYYEIKNNEYEVICYSEYNFINTQHNTYTRFNKIEKLHQLSDDGPKSARNI